MATRILEYGGADRIDDLQIVPGILTAQATLTASASSQQSAAFGSGTNMVCVQSDEAIHVTFGANPTATTAHYKIAAGGEQFFSVHNGHKAAIISA